MQKTLEIAIIKKHYEVLKLGRRLTALYGGTRSGKTYSILQYLLLEGLKGSYGKCSVVSLSFPHLRRGALADWLKIIEPLMDFIDYNKSTHTFILPHGNVIEFFSADSEAKLRGPGRDWLFVNEVNLLTHEEFVQLNIRTRDRVFVDFNPVAKFWLDDLLEAMDENKYVIAKSTYKDNPFLTEAQKEEIEALKAFPEMYKVYALGERGDVAGRAVWNYTVVDEWPEVERERPYIGIDFGFSHAYTAAVAVWQLSQNEVYVKELFYRQGNQIKELASLLQTIDYEACFADSANTEAINLLRQSGLGYINAARKLELRQSYALLNKWKLNITSSSKNLIKEINNLYWKDETRLNGADDHAIDALRYVVHYL